MIDGRPAAQERARQVHVEHRLPVGQRQLRDGRERGVAGAIDQKVELAETADGCLDHVGHLFLVGDVGL